MLRDEIERLALAGLFFEIGRFIIRADRSDRNFREAGTAWLDSAFPDAHLNEIYAQYSDLIERAAKLACGLVQDKSLPEETPTCGDVPLTSVFSLINPQAAGNSSTLQLLYPQPLSNRCNFPRSSITSEEMLTGYQKLWENFTQDCKQMGPTLNMPQALLLLEKFTSSIPHLTSQHTYDSGDAGAPSPGASLFEQMKMTACLSTCLQVAGKEAAPFLLVGGDFSGVQNFVYRISSAGALKTLRGRSFFLELLTEHVLWQLITTVGLSHAHVIISAGAVFSLLLPNTAQVRHAMDIARDRLNDYLLQQHAGNLYLAMDHVDLGPDELQPISFADKWYELGGKLNTRKGEKFASVFSNVGLLQAFLMPRSPQTAGGRTRDLLGTVCFWCGKKDGQLQEVSWNDENIYGCTDCLGKLTRDTECEICHRQALLNPLPPPRSDVWACPLCRSLYHIGEHLYFYKYAIASFTAPASCPKTFLKLPTLQASDDHPWMYYYFPMVKRSDHQPAEIGPDDYWAVAKREIGNLESVEAVFLINEWESRWTKKFPVRRIALGNYPGEAAFFQPKGSNTTSVPDDEIPIEFSKLAMRAHGIKRLGVLRMDVDNLGKLFVGSLPLAHRMALSRALNHFFKQHLNELCAGKSTASFADETQTQMVPWEQELKARDAVIVYSGGDDLFIVGTWNDMAELAYDIRKAFKQLTGGRVTISGGVTVHSSKFPLYQMARFSEAALSDAKQNKITVQPKHAGSDGPVTEVLEKDSLALFHPALLLSMEASGERLHERSVAALRWDAQDPACEQSASDWLSLATQLADVLGNGAQGLNWGLAASRSILRNLLNLVGEVEERGQLPLPNLAYALSRASLKSPEKNKAFFETLVPVLRQLDTFCIMHPALLWLEMRVRTGQEDTSP